MNSATSSPVAPRRAEIEIGCSSSGRPLLVHCRGPVDAARRIAVVAGQHGDEPEARAAALELLGSPEFGRWLARRSVRIAVLADANPDAAALGLRSAPGAPDLNRDHLMLEAAETRALHRFLRAFEPGLVVDVHAFRARRRRLSRHGYAYGPELLFDPPSHAGIPPGDGGVAVCDRTIAALESAGVTAGRWMVVDRHGRLRGGSTGLSSLRNAASARLGCATALVEIRQIGRPDAERFAARVRRACTALQELCRIWAELGEQPLTPSPSIARRARYRPGVPAHALPLRRVASGPASALPRLVVHGRHSLDGVIEFPAAYAIDPSCSELLGLLGRHGYVAEPGPWPRYPLEGRGAAWLTLLLDSRSHHGLRRLARRLFGDCHANPSSFVRAIPV